MAKITDFFWLIRPNRSPMVALITASAAFASGAGISKSIWMLLAGFCLATGGFSLDLYADRDLDLEGVRAAMRHNPLADGRIKVQIGLIISITLILISALITYITTRVALIAWVFIVIIFIGLALRIFETPIMRAFTLGALQSLYFLMGTASGKITLGLWFLAGMFFFAMCGGRGLTDIRDYPLDRQTRVVTLPKWMGIQKTALFFVVGLMISYAFSIAAFMTGQFDSIFIILVLIAIIIGIASAFLFLKHPNPKLAQKLTTVFMVGEGIIFTLAIVLGSLSQYSKFI